MNDNPQSTMRALQPDEIDEVSGGMLQHLAIWAMATVLTFGLEGILYDRELNGPTIEPTSGVRRGST